MFFYYLFLVILSGSMSVPHVSTNNDSLSSSGIVNDLHNSTAVPTPPLDFQYMDWPGGTQPPFPTFPWDWHRLANSVPRVSVQQDSFYAALLFLIFYSWFIVHCYDLLDLVCTSFRYLVSICRLPLDLYHTYKYLVRLGQNAEGKKNAPLKGKPMPYPVITGDFTLRGDNLVMQAVAQSPSMTHGSGLAGILPNAYTLPAEQRKGITIDGNVLNNWCFKHPGRFDKYDTDRQRYELCASNLSDFYVNNPDFVSRTIYVPDFIGCGLGGGNSILWKQAITACANLHDAKIVFVNYKPGVSFGSQPKKWPSNTSTSAPSVPEIPTPETLSITPEQCKALFPNCKSSVDWLEVAGHFTTLAVLFLTYLRLRRSVRMKSTAVLAFPLAALAPLYRLYTLLHPDYTVWRRLLDFCGVLPKLYYAKASTALYAMLKESFSEQAEAHRINKVYAKMFCFIASIVGSITGTDLMGDVVKHSGSLLGSSDTLFDNMDTLVYNLVGIDMFGTNSTRELVTTYEERANKYLGWEVHKCTKRKLKEIEDFIAVASDLTRNKNLPGVNTGPLSSRIASLVEKMAARKSAAYIVRTRPVTAGIYCYGPGGRGKNELVLNYIIPSLSKMFDVPNEYWNMMDSSKFEFPINNERWGFYDEFASLVKPDKAPGQCLNAIMSNGPAVMQGATLDTKTQTVNLTALFINSNNAPDDSNVKLGLVENNKAALISRLLCYHIDDPDYDPKRERSDQPHRKDDWSHLVITRVNYGAGKQTTKVRVTLKEVLDQIVDEIKRHQARFEQTKNIKVCDERVMQDDKPFVLWQPEVAESASPPEVHYIYGASGIGKTSALSGFIDTHQRFINRDICWITSKDELLSLQSRIKYDQPNTVYIVDDVLDFKDPELMDATRYIFDNAPSSSTIVYVSNYAPLCACSWWHQLKTYMVQKINGISLYEGCYRRIFTNIRYVSVNGWSTCKGVSVERMRALSNIFLKRDTIVFAPSPPNNDWDLDVDVGNGDGAEALIQRTPTNMLGRRIILYCLRNRSSIPSDQSGLIQFLRKLMEEFPAAKIRIVTTAGILAIVKGTAYIDIETQSAVLEHWECEDEGTSGFTVTSEPGSYFELTSEHLKQYQQKPQPDTHEELMAFSAIQRYIAVDKVKLCAHFDLDPRTFARHSSLSNEKGKTWWKTYGPVLVGIVGIASISLLCYRIRGTPMDKRDITQCGCVIGRGLSCYDSNADITDIFIDNAEGVNRAGGRGRKGGIRRVPGTKSFRFGGWKFYEDDLDHGSIESHAFHKLSERLRAGDYRSDGNTFYIDDINLGGLRFHAHARDGIWSIEAAENCEMVKPSKEHPKDTDTAKPRVVQNTVEVRNGNGRFVSFATMLNNRYGVMPLHVHTMVDNGFIEFWDMTTGNNCTSTYAPVLTDPVREVCLFKINTQGPFKDITSFVQTLDVVSLLDKATVYTIHRSGIDAFHCDFKFKKTIGVQEQFSIDALKRWGADAGVLYYGSMEKPTQNGSCGLPVWSTYEGRDVLVGFHAGSKVLESKLYCGILSRELLASQESTVAEGMPLSLHPACTPYVFENAPPLESSFVPHGPGLKHIGRVDRMGDMESGKHKVYATGFSEEDFPPMKFPTPSQTETLKLHGSKIPPDAYDNKHLHYSRTSAANGNVYDPTLTEELLPTASEIGDYLSAKFQHAKIDVLAPLDAVNGTREVSSLPLSGSVGGFFKRMFPKTSIKEDVYNREGFTTSGFAEMTTEQMTSWRKGKESNFPIVASMKQELLPLEKHHRQRAFYVVDPITVVNQRRVLAPIQSLLCKPGPASPFQLEYVPFADWHALRQRLLTIGSDVCCIDAKAFDWCVPGAVLESLSSFFASFYKFDRKDASSYRVMLRSLMRGVAFSPAVFNKDLIARQGGVPSGMYGTSLVDASAHLVMMFHIWKLWARRNNMDPSVHVFFENVCPIICGDDLTYSVSLEARWFNFSLIADEYIRLFGIRVTNDSKTGDADFVSMDEASFCSRKWVPIPRYPAWYMPKLKIESIVGTVHFSRSATQDIHHDQIVSASKELVAYGESKYNLFQKQVKLWCLANGREYVPGNFEEDCSMIKHLAFGGDNVKPFPVLSVAVNTNKFSFTNTTTNNDTMRITKFLAKRYANLRVDLAYWEHEPESIPLVANSDFEGILPSIPYSSRDKRNTFVGFSLNTEFMWRILFNKLSTFRMVEPSVDKFMRALLDLSFTTVANHRNNRYNSAVRAHRALARVYFNQRNVGDWNDVYAFFLNHAEDMKVCTTPKIVKISEKAECYTREDRDEVLFAYPSDTESESSDDPFVWIAEENTVDRRLDPPTELDPPDNVEITYDPERCVCDEILLKCHAASNPIAKLWINEARRFIRTLNYENVTKNKNFDECWRRSISADTIPMPRFSSDYETHRQFVCQCRSLLQKFGDEAKQYPWGYILKGMYNLITTQNVPRFEKLLANELMGPWKMYHLVASLPAAKASTPEAAEADMQVTAGGANPSVLVDSALSSTTPVVLDTPIMGGASVEVSQVMASTFGGLPGKLTAMTGVDSSILTKAYEAGYVTSFSIASTAAADTIVGTLQVNPWDSAFVNSSAKKYADLHEFFVGTVDLEFTVVSTPALFGQIAIVLIPAGFYESVVITSGNLHNFPHVIVALSANGTVTVRLRPTSLGDQLMCRRSQIEDGYNYGQLKVITLTPVSNAYGSEISSTIRVKSQLGPGAQYIGDVALMSTPSTSQIIDETVDYPRFPRVAYSTLATDGREKMRKTTEYINGENTPVWWAWRNNGDYEPNIVPFPSNHTIFDDEDNPGNRFCPVSYGAWPIRVKGNDHNGEEKEFSWNNQSSFESAMQSYGPLLWNDTTYDTLQNDLSEIPPAWSVAGRHYNTYDVVNGSTMYGVRKYDTTDFTTPCTIDGVGPYTLKGQGIWWVNDKHVKYATGFAMGGGIQIPLNHSFSASDMATGIICRFDDYYVPDCALVATSGHVETATSAPLIYSAVKICDPAWPVPAVQNAVAGTTFPEGILHSSFWLECVEYLKESSNCKSLIYHLAYESGDSIADILVNLDGMWVKSPNTYTLFKGELSTVVVSTIPSTLTWPAIGGVTDSFFGSRLPTTTKGRKSAYLVCNRQVVDFTLEAAEGAGSAAISAAGEIANTTVNNLFKQATQATRETFMKSMQGSKLAGSLGLQDNLASNQEHEDNLLHGFDTADRLFDRGTSEILSTMGYEEEAALDQQAYQQDISNQFSEARADSTSLSHVRGRDDTKTGAVAAQAEPVPASIHPVVMNASEKETRGD